jgi:hypothetical protein
MDFREFHQMIIIIAKRTLDFQQTDKFARAKAEGRFPGKMEGESKKRILIPDLFDWKPKRMLI